MRIDPFALTSAGLVFGTIFFLLLALLSGNQAGSALARQRLESFKRGGGPEADVSPERPAFGSRVVRPMLQRAATGLANLLPKAVLKGVEKQLVTAGEPMTLNGFLTMVLVSSIASTAFAMLIVVASRMKMSGTTLGMIVGVALVGFYLPFWILKSRARQRQTATIKSLPDAFDLITTCVEAGLGLDAALSRVAEKVQGPFADELSRSLRDIALGKPRRDALKELGERTSVPDLVQFTNAVIQAEAMGSSIGTVLRVQAEQLRVRRRQRAEEAAYKAPVKMLFPLVLCIFPTLFIVILGPAAITITQSFPK